MRLKLKAIRSFVVNSKDKVPTHHLDRGDIIEVNESDMWYRLIDQGVVALIAKTEPISLITHFPSTAKRRIMLKTPEPTMELVVIKGKVKKTCSECGRLKVAKSAKEPFICNHCQDMRYARPEPRNESLPRPSVRRDARAPEPRQQRDRRREEERARTRQELRREDLLREAQRIEDEMIGNPRVMMDQPLIDALRDDPRDLPRGRRRPEPRRRREGRVEIVTFDDEEW